MPRASAATTLPVCCSPAITERLLLQRHGEAAITAWKARRDVTREQAASYHREADSGHFRARYRFGVGVLEGPELEVSATHIHIPGYAQPVSLKVDNPFGRLDDGDD